MYEIYITILYRSVMYYNSFNFIYAVYLDNISICKILLFLPLGFL